MTDDEIYPTSISIRRLELNYIDWLVGQYNKRYGTRISRSAFIVGVILGRYDVSGFIGYVAWLREQEDVA